MAEGNSNGKISVSREVLRAELAELKLDLIDRLASRQEVADLEKRVSLLETAAARRQHLENDVNGIQTEFIKLRIKLYSAIAFLNGLWAVGAVLGHKYL